LGHLNPLTPDLSGLAGATAGFAYSAIQYNKYLQWLPLKYSNIYRVNALGRAVNNIGNGVLVGALVYGDVALAEGLFDEITALRNGECQ
jgi:hypothetical protein